uniref:Uncharacterized protein n=1 Tax=Lotharella globosa TaxID=91324 RepID=A0A7S4E228_9EUKA
MVQPSVRCSTTPTYATPTYSPPTKQRHTYTMGVVPKPSSTSLTPRYSHKTKGYSYEDGNGGILNPCLSPVAKTETPHSMSRGSRDKSFRVERASSKDRRYRDSDSGSTDGKRDRSGRTPSKYLQTRRRTT